MPEKQNKRQIAFARERLVIGEVILALLMAIFEHHSRSLKDNFGSSLETMAIGMAVLLSQLVDEPSSIMLLAKVLKIPTKSVELRLKELADNGVLIKDGRSYVPNPEVLKIWRMLGTSDGCAASSLAPPRGWRLIMIASSYLQLSTVEEGARAFAG